MLRRLYADQPAAFAFTPANLAWAKGQITKYPAGRQASAIIPLLWRAQEQEGWLTRPAIEHVADLLGMAYIRALEVATFYFMFHLQPVGSVAHIQICGTTSCMICGAEDLIRVCKDKIAAAPHTLSADGKFSWEEVECLGACTNAPMAQIGKDYYEDLTPAKLGQLLDDMAAGKRPVPGPQNGRYAAEPLSGLTSLKDFESGRTQYNGTVQRQTQIGDGFKRIDGSEVPMLMPWQGRPVAEVSPATAQPRQPKPGSGTPADATGATVQEAPAEATGKPPATDARGNRTARGGTATGEPGAPSGPVLRQPETLTGPRGGRADDLQVIEGIGPRMEALLHSLGFYHFDQLARWTAEEIAWVDSNLKSFKGRLIRERWVEQARDLLKDRDKT
jgi:NADH-quinone oxidoreductase subunit E